MAAIGNQITSAPYVNDVFSGTGSQTAFTLTFAPATTAAIAVHVSGVYQAPSAYTLSGTTLTFNSAPAVGSSNIQVLHLSIGFVAQVPSDGSVTTAKIATGAVTETTIADGAITAAKIADGAIIAADIAANTVTPAKLAYNAAGTFLTTDGATVLWRAQSALAIANTQITGNIISSQITSVANTQITGNIISSQITSVANTQVTGTMTIAQGGTGSTTLAGANIAVLNSTQTFTAAQRGTITTLTDGANVTPDFAVTNNYTLTLAGNRTLVNPTNLTAGQSGSIFILQDGTGSRTLAYGSSWDFAGGTAPTLSTAASSVDRLDYVVRSNTSIHTVFTAAYS